MENISQISEAIINESIKPFEAYRKLREIADNATALMAEIKDAALNQLKEDGGNFEDDTFKVTLTRSAGTWNFKHIPQYNAQKEVLKEMEDSYKEAFKAWEKGRVLKDSLGGTIEPALYKEGADTFTFKSKNK